MNKYRPERDRFSPLSLDDWILRWRQKTQVLKKMKTAHKRILIHNHLFIQSVQKLIQNLTFPFTPTTKYFLPNWCTKIYQIFIYPCIHKTWAICWPGYHLGSKFKLLLPRTFPLFATSAQTSSSWNNLIFLKFLWFPPFPQPGNDHSVARILGRISIENWSHLLFPQSFPLLE